MWVKLRSYLIKLARDEGIPKPKGGIAKIPIPNAIAFDGLIEFPNFFFGG
jgi:hypothetical protein